MRLLQWRPDLSVVTSLKVDTGDKPAAISVLARCAQAGDLNAANSDDTQVAREEGDGRGARRCRQAALCVEARHV
eukprot:7389259-Prymnesium_polylepis.2